MSVPIYSTNVVRGTTYKRVYTWKSDPLTPIDITGYTFASMIKKSPNDAAPLAVCICAVTDGPAGKFSVTLSPVKTLSLPLASQLFQDIVTTYPDGTKRRLVSIHLTVENAITQ